MVIYQGSTLWAWHWAEFKILTLSRVPPSIGRGSNFRVCYNWMYTSWDTQLCHCRQVSPFPWPVFLVEMRQAVVLWWWRLHAIPCLHCNSCWMLAKTLLDKGKTPHLGSQIQYVRAAWNRMHSKLQWSRPEFCNSTSCRILDPQAVNGYLGNREKVSNLGTFLG